MIQADDDYVLANAKFELPYFDSTSIVAWFGSKLESPDQISIQRANGSLFDASGFDDTGYNRGWITIYYEA